MEIGVLGLDEMFNNGIDSVGAELGDQVMASTVSRGGRTAGSMLGRFDVRSITGDASITFKITSLFELTGAEQSQDGWLPTNSNKATCKRDRVRKELRDSVQRDSE